MSTTEAPPATQAARYLVRRKLIKGVALSAAAIALRPLSAATEPNTEILRSEEAIHQERSFRAARRRVYDALTVQGKFDKMVQLSGVMRAPAMAKMQRPTVLSDQVGSEFALFGGYIIGRQIELAPNELIVQAWRVLSWAPGLYSIARFELTEQHGLTKLIFDHRAFPHGQAEHLASGWQEHYWDPLARLLM